MKSEGGFLLLLLVTSAVLGPAEIEAQPTLGFQGGLTSATFGGTQTSDYGHRLAINVGAFLDLPVSEWLEGRVGVGYTGKGAETDSGGEWTQTRIGYVEIPVLVKVRMVRSSGMSAHLLLGPTASVKASCRFEFDSSYWGHHTTGCEEGGSAVRALDLAATGGVEVQVELSREVSLVGTSLYSLGLRTVRNSGEGGKHRTISASVGLAIPID